MRVGNLNNWREFLKAPIYIGQDTSELQEELDTNFWAINITTDDQRRLTEPDFQVMFRRIYAKSYHYLHQSKQAHGIYFYLWFDKQAGQLRFSFISDLHTELPFKASVNIVSFAQVIQECLDSTYVEGFPFDELPISDYSSSQQYQENTSENYSVNVYVRRMRPFFELITGEIFEVVPNSYSIEVITKISYHMHLHMQKNNIEGSVTSVGGPYEIANDHYIPDLAFTAFDKESKSVHITHNPSPPDLAVEVLTPTDKGQTVLRKIVNYLAENVVVWVVNPEEKTVEVYQPGKPAVVLSLSDTIDGGNVLMGFKLPVKDIFPPEDNEDESTETSD